ncbi:cellulase family glycosylhydrolase [Nocardioides sp. BYT-33-1]|uniref:cellulase family glycosylhydrolase n=1 Tax=Nocardioides sp. BYT-33-1 TaxID=3416952 RepID=UPI003F53A106
MRLLLQRALVALGVVGLLATGALATRLTWAPSADPGPSPAASTVTSDPTRAERAEPPVPAAPDPDLGVQLSAHHRSKPDYARRVLARLAESGAGWVRVDVGWATLQPTPSGRFERWYAELIDDVLAAARDHDLKVIVEFWLTPSWSSPNGSRYAPPTDPAAYARAIGRAAQRWGHLVDAWEVWNEPNFEGFFEGADPQTYVNLLCAAYPAVKAYDDAPVLFGGIMYNDAPWLTRAYEAGAAGCFDALAVHPYIGPSDAAPETASVGAVWRLTSTPMVHDVMAQWGDGGKQVWITELGWSTGTENDGNPWDRPVSIPQQADFLRRAVDLVRAEYPYVGPIIWYRDVDGPTKAYQDGFGLMRADLRAKPALRSFEAAVRGD